MAYVYTYVSVKVDDDDVLTALAECKAAAVTQLGSPNVELYEKTWTDKRLCTSWRLVTPDPYNPP